MSVTSHRKARWSLAFCGIQLVSMLLSTSAYAQVGASIRNLQPNPATEPTAKGDISCIEIELEQKKQVCRYIPVNELASNIQSSLLRVFFGGRQPVNPDEAYVRVLNNGQLEFAHVDPKYIEKMIQYIPSLDTLDMQIERRKVNIVVQILQLMEGSDDSAGFLLGAQYSGKDRATVKAEDRFATSTTGGLISFNFAFGNLVNTLIDAALTNYKQNNNVKVISSVPLMLTHGYQLGNVNPYSKPIYIQTTSVSAVPEQEGIRFEGQARFNENSKSKIVIKDFAINVSQYEPAKSKKDGVVEGVETFRSPVRDLELEIGCSTAIRVINVARKANTKERNWIFGSKDEVKDSKKVFLFLIQAVNDSTGTPASTTCSETNAAPEFNGHN